VTNRFMGGLGLAERHPEANPNSAQILRFLCDFALFRRAYAASDAQRSTKCTERAGRKPTRFFATGFWRSSTASNLHATVLPTSVTFSHETYRI
jgi:hypothetical protein